MVSAKFCKVTADVPWDPYSEGFNEGEEAFQMNLSSLKSEMNPVKFEYLNLISQPWKI